MSITKAKLNKYNILKGGSIMKKFVVLTIVCNCVLLSGYSTVSAGYLSISLT